MKKFLLVFISTALLAACDKERKECPNPSEKTYDLSGFKMIKAGEAFQVTIRKGAQYSVKARGCSDDLADLVITTSLSGLLEARYSHYRRERYQVELTIELPVLTSVNLDGASNGTIDGFGGQNSTIRTVLSGASKCSLNGAAINSQVELSGASTLNISGNTESLYGNISGASRLETYPLQSKEVDLSVSGASRAWVHPMQSFFADASGDSRVYYRGNPPVSHLTTSGNGRIIHE